MVETLEWRNWQTHETQNLALVTQHGGSTPPSSIWLRIRQLAAHRNQKIWRLKPSAVPTLSG